MFIELLGNDSQLLTDEPIKSHDLFNKLTSDIDNEIIESVDEELYYLKLIRDIRDKDPKLFDIIENIPKKARIGRKSDNTALISLMQSNNYKKVFKTTATETTEIDFFEAVKELKAKPDEKSVKINSDYYTYLSKNLKSFKETFTAHRNKREYNPTENFILNNIQFALKFKKELTSYDINRLIKVKKLIQEGHVTRKRLQLIKKEMKGKKLKASEIVDILRKTIRDEDLLTDTSSQKTENNITKQIILSEYFLE